MEKAFIVNRESKLYKDIKKYRDLESEQKKFINKFFKEYDIEANTYRITGDGLINKPFQEYDSNISLYIDPTENDLKKYGKILNKQGRYGLRAFRKTSKIAKEFTKQCIDEQIVINLWYPRVGDYFESISFYGCGFTIFENEECFYLRVESDFLKENDIPEGFKEIKLSDFHIAKEKFENNKENN
ncbi:hypothetical protein FDF74_02785 [Clostridium niameyense]|uniref:Uncharacterized protein n=1 Tax=Clostridium niameyense TaxID=1622073 RepID=A0A6M0R7B4_9CLOT|nr:hypothetical protein [Clostridium niameyense]NEZ46136.1 hypothetical protein [Clostridium niameyense]